MQTNHKSSILWWKRSVNQSTELPSSRRRKEHRDSESHLPLCFLLSLPSPTNMSPRQSHIFFIGVGQDNGDGTAPPVYILEMRGSSGLEIPNLGISIKDLRSHPVLSCQSVNNELILSLHKPRNFCMYSTLHIHNVPRGWDHLSSSRTEKLELSSLSQLGKIGDFPGLLLGIGPPSVETSHMFPPFFSGPTPVI